MRTQGKITHSLYCSAPDMLLDMIAEIHPRLEKEKARNGESEAYHLWLKVSNVLKFAWDYFEDLKFIQKRNDQLEMDNALLKEWCRQKDSKLEKFEVFREAKIDGSFNETVEIVNKYLSRHENKSE